MEQKFTGISYSVKEEEIGKIPMTNRSYHRYSQANIVNIGTVGGVVKPTTGYAFLRILAESKQVAQKLVSGKRVVESNTSPSRFAFYDRLLLQILQEKGWLGKGIFSALFRSNPMRRILTFLDEGTSWNQELLIFARLPKKPFLNALWRQFFYPLRRSKRLDADTLWNPTSKLPNNQRITTDLPHN